MNSQEFARKALVLIYQTTTTQMPGFDISRIIQGTQSALPACFSTDDLATNTAFITALEAKAEVLPEHELQGLARLAQTLAAFENAMHYHFASGELPVSWARRFKDCKSDYRTLDLLHQGMKNLVSEAE
ncbi:MAG TPA: hypothetical protein VFH06_04810 [Candidatus Saccharimonadales bacterium]|nr:hypothetical protein [Candidatus Saccharimonadales bacterium]